MTTIAPALPVSAPTRERKPWTVEDERTLLEEGNAAPRGGISDVIERVASERGVAPATVRAKYYKLRNEHGITGMTKRRKRRTSKRWSAQADRKLLREVTQAPAGERNRVYAEWAERRGVSVGAIQARYYRLKRETPQAAARATESTKPAPLIAPMPQAAGAATDLSALTMLELAALARCTNEELERRVSALHHAVGTA